MNAITRKLLCGAVLAALPIGSALACTTGAWDNGESNSNGLADTTAIAGSPSPDGIARYSGACGLEPADGAASFVMDNTPAAEGAASSGGGQPYRARFYVLAANPGASTAVFRATDADDGAGNELVSVDFDGTAFTFFQGGAQTDSVNVTAGRWYSIEIFYQVGEASTATVESGAIGFSEVASLGTPASGTIGSIQLGAIDGAANASALKFDEFESTRSETTAIGRLCRGDADGSGARNSSDGLAIRNEFLSGGSTLATGQPDCDENGSVNSTDGLCVRNIFLAGQGACS